MTFVAKKRPCEEGALCFFPCPECRDKLMNITVYSKPNCPWCVKAKELLNKLNLPYEEQILDVHYTREQLRELLPDNLPLTVPQIWVNYQRIGGYEDFAEWCDNHGYGNGG